MLCSALTLAASAEKTVAKVELYVHEDGVVKRCAATMDPLEPVELPTSSDQILDANERVIIVWLDDARWFVVKQRVKSEPKRTGACTTVLDGSLNDFVNYSPLINAAFKTRAPLAGSGIQLSSSAGMPNTTTYALTVEPTGRYAVSYGGFMVPAGTNGFDPHRLTQLLVKAVKAGVGADAVARMAPQFAHDRQQTTLRLSSNGTPREVPLEGAAVTFVSDVMKAYEIDTRPANRKLGR